MIAGLSGDSGKTLVSLALLLLARQQGIPTRAFKKGPDYIDAAWLSWASGKAARNLDTFLMGGKTATRLFATHARADGLNVVEGNRGLYDGVDEIGTHSTAELAKLLKAPVALVVDATKATRTVAALVLGCQTLDRHLSIRGVILNRVANPRQEAILRKAVESICGIPVLGALPKREAGALPSNRHLGLVTPEEHDRLEELRSELLALAGSRLDAARILEIAASAPAVEYFGERPSAEDAGAGLKIAYLEGSPFTFYYPDNLEALENAGAQLEPIPALSAASLPEDVDAMYIGGGFPETHAARLTANAGLRSSVRQRALEGLPIYAECGGLMFLAEAIRREGKRFPMAGVLPYEAEVFRTPQGHGYVELLVDRANPFYPVGTTIRAHEFHYSRLLSCPAAPETACAVRRGVGTFDGRDGVLRNNVWASYAHVHAAATPKWAKGMLRAARAHAARRGAGTRRLSLASEAAW